MKKILPVIFIFTIAFVFATAVKSGAETLLESKKSSSGSSWNAEKAFPFENQSEKTDKENKSENLINKVNNTVKKGETFFENTVTGKYPYQMKAVLLKNYFQKYLCGYNMTTAFNGTSNEAQTVVSLEDGNLHFVLENEDIKENTNKIINFAKWVKNDGRNILYFIPPSKIDYQKISSEYKGVYTDYTKVKKSEEKNAFKKAGIDYLESKTLNEKLKNGEEVFFKTDHHWLPSSAILASKDISEHLNANYGYSIDTAKFNLANYKKEITKYPILGSQGKKVTQVYTKKEPFSIFLPKYKTDLTVFYSKLNKTLKGTAEDTMFDMKPINNDLYGNDQYTVFAYNNQGYIRIHNNLSNDNKHILLIKLSYANPMIPFVGNMAEDVDVVDIRFFEGSVKTLIKERNPDTVIVFYGLNAINKENESFKRDRYDFN